MDAPGRVGWWGRRKSHSAVANSPVLILYECCYLYGSPAYLHETPTAAVDPPWPWRWRCGRRDRSRRGGGGVQLVGARQIGRREHHGRRWRWRCWTGRRVCDVPAVGVHGGTIQGRGRVPVIPQRAGPVDAQRTPCSDYFAIGAAQLTGHEPAATGRPRQAQNQKSLIWGRFPNKVLDPANSSNPEF